jgi:hypothetical protein
MPLGFKITRVDLDNAKLHKFLNTPHSGDSMDLWKYLEIKKKLAVADAKRMVGVRTGALRASIVGRHLGNFTGQYLWIGSSQSHALAHHEGTKPHIIRPREAKALRFTKGTSVIYTTMVRHPGTKPNPYLSRQLHHFRG